MAETTHISWADATLNFWIGCTEVSNGPKGACTGCYARQWGARFGVPWGVGAPRRKTVHNLAKAKKLEREAVAKGSPLFCFSNSLADIFDNEVPIEWLAEAFDIMGQTPHVIYLLLTKRAPIILKRIRAALALLGWKALPSNIALGITVVTQTEADRDIPHLLIAKAALNPLFVFLSIEPMQGCMDIAWSLSRNRLEVGSGIQRRGHFSPGLETLGRVDWVLAGGETDQGSHKARPSHPDWFRRLRDDCAAAGTPFHLKQNGEWLHMPERAHFKDLAGDPWRRVDSQIPGVRPALMFKVGKKAAGRELDGITHDSFPAVR